MVTSVKKKKGATTKPPLGSVSRFGFCKDRLAASWRTMSFPPSAQKPSGPPSMLTDPQSADPLVGEESGRKARIRPGDRNDQASQVSPL